MSSIRTFKIAQITRETPEAVVIDLQVTDSEAISFLPGQFITLRIPIEGKLINRSYSICSSPNELPRISVAVKQIKDGTISKYLNQNLKVGEILEAVEPMGNFTLKVNPESNRPLILFGAGSGITPLLSILKTSLQQEPNTKVNLIYANENENQIIFKNELKTLEAQYPDRLRVFHILKNPLQTTPFTGLPNTTLLLHILGMIPEAAHSNTEFYMCGPEGFMQVVKQSLQDAMIPTNRVHKESFAAPPADPDAPKTESPLTIQTQTVKVIFNKKDYTFSVKPDESILNAALDKGIDLPYSCQGGVCTACRGKLKSGKMHLDEREGLSDSELNEGFVLTCVGHPLTNDVVIEIG
jgi:ring-1,2-phenylacetyl-CoA epoxidase subunit PaaE